MCDGGVSLRDLEDELDWRENAGRPSIDAAELAALLVAIAAWVACLRWGGLH